MDRGWKVENRTKPLRNGKIAELKLSGLLDAARIFMRARAVDYFPSLPSGFFSHRIFINEWRSRVNCVICLCR